MILRPETFQLCSLVEKYGIEEQASRFNYFAFGIPGGDYADEAVITTILLECQVILVFRRSLHPLRSLCQQ
jgi:hypothetical protein